MFTAFIVCEVLGVIAFLGYMCIEDREKLLMVTTISGLFFIMGLICFTCDNRPTALDVYQGKTTLEITYRDNIPVDSVVVYKNN